MSQASSADTCENPPSGRKSQEQAPLLRNKASLLRRLFRMGGSNRELLIDSEAEAVDETNSSASVSEDRSQSGLGTFSGVIAPVALSQISTLLFLRLGFLVANAGYIMSIVYLMVAYVILTMTISSISAISTNGLVEGGGVYFMISRTLGPEAGGAIGALFFCANIFSSALYATGALEGILEVFGETTGSSSYDVLPEGDFYKFGYATALNFFNMTVCLFGAMMFAKATVGTLIVVLTCVMSVIVSFIGIQHVIEIPIPANNPKLANHTGNYTGFSKDTLRENLFPDFTLDYTTGNIVDFATCFGVLFTGVTGIMAGANMSGELQNPGKSIPRGTIIATLFTGFLYIILLTLTASTTSRYLLTNDYMFMSSVNYWYPFVTIGIITATSSASLSCLIGASRVLAALTKDNLYGAFTSWVRKFDSDTNPIGSVIISALLVEAVLLIGELNTIARFTAVFFLLSYCAVNFACVLLEWASAPNFRRLPFANLGTMGHGCPINVRPTYTSFSLYTSLAGGAATAILMIVISPIVTLVATLVTVFLMVGIYVYGPVAPYQWGSLSQALIFHQVRKYLLKLDTRKEHVKFWRPKMLLLVSNPGSACPLIDFVNDLKKSGLYVIGNVQVQELGPTSVIDNPMNREENSKETPRNIDPVALVSYKYKNLVEHLKVKAFVEVAVAPYVSAGVQQLVRLSGIGAMKPNIFILGFADESESINFLTRESSPYTAVKPQYKPKSRDMLDLQLLANWKNEDTKINTIEYCSMLYEVSIRGMNLIVARHFHLFDKEAILNSLSKKFIDIWPMNFLGQNQTGTLDTCSLFFLNLAQVLNMQSNWKHKSELRVFICVENEQEKIRKLKEVHDKLNEVRIKAKIVDVVWGHISALGKNVRSVNSTKRVFELMSDEYLDAVNQMIRENSNNTSVSFLYLEPPPHAPDKKNLGHYFRCLKRLTEHLHPTLLCHGVDEVTTSHL